MLIRSILNDAKIGTVRTASNQNRQILNDFINVCSEIAILPERIYYDYFHGEDALMNIVGRSLAKDYPLTLHKGFNKSPNFFTTSVKSIKLGDIIEQATKKKFIVGANYFPKYSFESYRQLCHIVLAMTFAKYDVKSLYKEHIIYTLISVMFRLYHVYDNGQFNVNVMDVAKMLSEVLDGDTVQFDVIANQYGFLYRESDVRTRYTSIKRKPTCADDLTECFTEGMTQTEKKEAIMKWWCCGSTTARNYMKKYGLTDDKYTRSDYKELHEHIDEAVDEVVEAVSEHIDEATDNVIEHLSEIRNDIRNLHQSFSDKYKNQIQ